MLVWLFVVHRVLEYPVEDTITEMVGLMCLTCPKMSCTGCPKVVKAPLKVEKNQANVVKRSVDFANRLRSAQRPSDRIFKPTPKHN